ncbi:hypothetical protein MBLNU230_g2009t1 [Neophaeotheca triangularis]
MASLPQSQDSQPRMSENSSTTQSQDTTPDPTSPVRSRSANSEDSQTLFLNSPPPAEAPSPTSHPQTASDPPPTQSAPPSTEDQTKKCWICFADSSEDPATGGSPWRSPCPCALTAHETCLLDWIADLEAPNNSTPRNANNRRGLLSQPPILCPQCKNEIKLARPRDYIVDAVRGFERAVQRSITPSALGALAMALHQISVRHGVYAIYAVFGAEDGTRILRPLVDMAMQAPLELDAGALGPGELSRELGRYYARRLSHWRLYMGLPLISPMLVLSRTALADYVLPALPVMFLASMPGEAAGHRAGLEGLVSWPPSAGVCFSLLPYVRAGYNEFYRKVWGEHEKRWMREIQPRQGQGREEGGPGLGEAQAQGGEPAEDENVFEIRVDGGLWDDWGGQDEGQEAQPQEAANNDAQNRPPQNADDEALPPPIPDNRPPLAEIPQADNNNENVPPANAQPAPAAAAAGGNQQGERRLSFSPTAIAESILGALLFPSLASASGELLKLLLPHSWTVPPLAHVGLRAKGGGILQHKWGRSLIGGCLLVAAKDAVVLYVRWRMAVMHRGRRVLDHGHRDRGRVA